MRCLWGEIVAWESIEQEGQDSSRFIPSNTAFFPCTKEVPPHLIAFGDSQDAPFPGHEARVPHPSRFLNAPTLAKTGRYIALARTFILVYIRGVVLGQQKNCETRYSQLQRIMNKMTYRGDATSCRSSVP